MAENSQSGICSDRCPPSQYNELLAVARANLQLQLRPATTIQSPRTPRPIARLIPASRSPTSADTDTPSTRSHSSSPVQLRSSSLSLTSTHTPKRSKSINNTLPPALHSKEAYEPEVIPHKSSRQYCLERQLLRDVKRSAYLEASKDASDEARTESAALAIRRIAPFRADIQLQKQIIANADIVSRPPNPIVIKYPHSRLRLWTAAQREQQRQAECVERHLDDRLSQQPAEKFPVVLKIVPQLAPGKYYFGVNPPRAARSSRKTKPLLSRRLPTTLSAGNGKASVPGVAAGTICISELLEEKDMPALSMETSARTDIDRRPNVETKANIPAERTRAKKGAVKFMRCIDKVTFGDLLFTAGYWSGYPEETIGKTGRAGTELTVKTLYVCKKCFAYSAVITDYVKHCQLCSTGIPGIKVYEHGSWSVWECDGEVENKLSLFGKLFLEKKSVYYDVHAFNYFLLVHTSSTGDTSIVGFFSKEKMSWDCNNLACIIVFPPWQRRGLGQILMGVSYEISRREEVMGGPEKPISEKGAAGYKRYWGREIARWLLEAKVTNEKNGKGTVTVEDISAATWIQPEDCLTILKDMKVVTEANARSEDPVTLGAEPGGKVKVDKEMIRQWVTEQNIDLKRVVDPDGFLVDYGFQKSSSMDG